MTRASFGGGVADFVVTAAAPGDKLEFAAAVLTFWDAEAGGAQYDDLLLNDVPVETITVSTDGQIPTFKGPDGVLAMWAQAGGVRVRLDAVADFMAAAAGVADGNMSLVDADPDSTFRTQQDERIKTTTADGIADDEDPRAEAVDSRVAGQAFTQGRQRNLREAAGVDPTGSTVSSNALQEAIDEALTAGAPSLLPPGRYKASGLTFDPGNNQDITLEGSGYETVLVPDGDDIPVITLDGGASNTQRQMIRGLTFDLDGKDAPAIRTVGLGQRGTLADLSIYGMGATYTHAVIELGTTALDPLVSFLIDNVQVKGGGTTVGTALKFFANPHSGRIRNFRAVNIGKGIVNDSNCHAGTDLRLEGLVLEQCTVGLELLLMNLIGLTLRDSRIEAASSVAVDLSGLDTNYRLCAALIQALYVSGMTSGSIGVRIAKMAQIALEHSSFRAVNGLSSGTYPVGTPVDIGANVSGYRQRGNRNDAASASGGSLVPSSVGAMSFSGAFLPSTDITRDLTSSDVVNQQAANVTVFTASGTFTPDTRAKSYELIVVGPGPGGGSGRRGAAGTNRCGAGGASGGQVTRLFLPASAVTSDVAVTVGTKGTGGAAVTTDDTDGNPGNAASGASLFGTFAKANPGSPGAGGTNATGTGGSAPSSSGHFPGGSGASASTVGAAGNASPNSIAGAAGGGAGGGINTSDTVSAGGLGGVVGAHASGGPGAAGTSGGGNGGNGTDSPADSGIPGPSGGGGGSSKTSAAGRGGNGGKYGAGGGGGGASLNGFNSGAGGDGADGIVIVIAHY